MTDLLLVRHGIPLSRTSTDPPLADRGREQSRLVAEWLACEPVDQLYTSPLRRARETAEPFEQVLGLRATAMPELREWEPERPPGWTYTVVEDLEPDHPRALALAAGRYEAFVPRLDLAAFRARSLSALTSLLERGAGGRVVAITHGEVINAALAALIGSERVFWFYPEYTSISRVRGLDEGPVICSVNEVAHLEVARRAKSGD